MAFKTKLTRRNFLAWAGLSAVGAVGCNVFGQDGEELRLQSPVLQPEDLVKGRDNWYATLCRCCPTSEGVLVRVMEGRAKKVQGNPTYPVNQGKQSARCDGGLQALYHPDRLAGPMRRTGPRGSADSFAATSWERALDQLSTELGTRGEGLLLITEPLRAHPGLIASKFASAFGGKHLGFEALDQTTYRTAVRSVYGQDLLPDFDIGNANYLLSFGADLLSTWVSPTRWSVGYGEFRQGEGRSQRGTHVHVDPRFSMTAANADKWLPIKPGLEGYLALSLAHVIISEGLQAGSADVDALTGGRGAAALDAFSPGQVGPMLDFPDGILGGHSSADYIRYLARDFAGHTPALALGGDSAAAHSNGLFNLEAIYALNYLVGSVGQTGGVRFNPGSPLPNLPAQSAAGSLADWSGAVSDINSGRTRLVMVHSADPVYGLPPASGLAQALNRDDLFIVSFSSFMDQTTAMADLVLPDRNYLEDWGSDIPDPGPGFPDPRLPTTRRQPPQRPRPPQLQRPPPQRRPGSRQGRIPPLEFHAGRPQGVCRRPVPTQPGLRSRRHPRRILEQPAAAGRLVGRKRHRQTRPPLPGASMRTSPTGPPPRATSAKATTCSPSLTIPCSTAATPTCPGSRARPTP